MKKTSLLTPLALALAAALPAALPAAAAGAATPYSIEDFARHASYSSARISPSGAYLAISVDLGDQDVLTILRTSDLKVLKVNQLPDKKSVGSFHWISPERLMFNAVKKQGGYAQPFPTGEWFAVNADGSQARPVIFYGTRDATQRSKSVGNESYSLLDTLRGDDQNVIMQVRYPRSSEGAGTQVVSVDTISGRRTPLARAPKENCDIALDGAKEPRFAVCSSSRDESGEYDERSELYRRDGTTWTLINASKSGVVGPVLRATRRPPRPPGTPTCRWPPPSGTWASTPLGVGAARPPGSKGAVGPRRRRPGCTVPRRASAPGPPRPRPSSWPVPVCLLR